MIRYIFALVALLVFVGINAYVYTRFLKRLHFLESYKKFIKWAIIVVVILEIIFFMTLRFNTLSSEVFYLIASLIGISFMLFCTALVYDLFHIPLNKMTFDSSKRLMLKSILDVTMLIFAISYMLKGFLGGLKRPIVNDVHVKIKGLEKPLNIVQISDLHVGQVLGKKFLHDIITTINDLHADIVVITGDLVDIEVDKLGDMLDPLLYVKSKYGVYFVPGNHEYFHGVEEIITKLESLHVKVLKNSHEKVAGINLAGVYDLMGERLGSELKPNVSKAIENVDKKLPIVLLAHQPKQTKYLKGDEDIDLIISGHTHGGQIFPFGLLVLLEQPYLHGLYQHNKKTQIYVSSGAGFWGPPVRVFAPSEIVRLNLR